MSSSKSKEVRLIVGVFFCFLECFKNRAEYNTAPGGLRKKTQLRAKLYKNVRY